MAIIMMEVVARRKGVSAKGKYEPFSEVEVATGSQIALWRTWTVCLLMGCVFTITAGLWGTSISTPYASSSSTTMAVNHPHFSHLPAMTFEEVGIPLPDPTPAIYVQDAVVFPDNLMLLVRVSTSQMNLERSMDSLECRFSGVSYDSASETRLPVISIRPRTKDLQIVRCSLPQGFQFLPMVHSNVTLRIRDSEVRVETNALYHPHAPPTWDALVYETLVDTDTMILLAKGLVTRSSKKMDTASLKCVFGSNLPSEVLYETSVVTAAQEVVRCEKPGAHLDDKLRGLRVSIKASWIGVLPSVTYYDPDNESKNFLASFVRAPESSSAPAEDLSGSVLDDDFQTEEDRQAVVMPREQAVSSESSPAGAGTAADEERFLLRDPEPRRKLCACTMVWNKAQFIREWVLFHSFIGVEEYFVFDNDSDDGTEEVLDSLRAAYNVSRMVWPWLKTQQAAFSHCTIVARERCEWVLFTDVDEYIYPYAYLKQPGAEGSDALVLHRLIDAESRDARDRGESLAQIQFDCNNFGPSGLTSTPKQGVTVGYTCRLKAPERHKSIVMLDALDSSLLNVLHHFELQEGFHSVRLHRRVAVCNHYKYQAWDAFKMKFVRRAGTYTTDWKKEEGRGSKDRTPGLGTQAVKPDDWESRFCQVKDEGLREFSLRTFAVPGRPNTMAWQVDDDDDDDEQPSHVDAGLTAGDEDQVLPPSHEADEEQPRLEEAVTTLEAEDGQTQDEEAQQ